MDFPGSMGKTFYLLSGAPGVCHYVRFPCRPCAPWSRPAPRRHYVQAGSGCRPRQDGLSRHVHPVRWRHGLDAGGRHQAFRRVPAGYQAADRTYVRGEHLSFLAGLEPPDAFLVGNFCLHCCDADGAGHYRTWLTALVVRVFSFLSKLGFALRCPLYGAWPRTRACFCRRSGSVSVLVPSACRSFSCRRHVYRPDNHFFADDPYLRQGANCVLSALAFRAILRWSSLWDNLAVWRWDDYCQRHYLTLAHQVWGRRRLVETVHFVCAKLEPRHRQGNSPEAHRRLPISWRRYAGLDAAGGACCHPG